MSPSQLLLPVLSVCARDEPLARLQLRLCSKLDGCIHSELLIVSDDAGVMAHLSGDALLAFANVSTFCYSTWKGNPAWPHPQNWAWQETARYLDSVKQGYLKAHPCWLWWEPDATPLRSGWLTALTEAYRSSPKKTFAGAACRHGPLQYMNGVGLYPFDIVDALANCHALYARAEPFDIAAATCLMRDFKPLDNLSHEWKAKGGQPGRQYNKREAEILQRSDYVLHHGANISLPLILLGPDATIPSAPYAKNQTHRENHMNETSKAMRRRRCEEAGGGFKWSEIFTGNGVDVGAGNDPIQLPNCRPFDMYDGDANFLSRYIPKESLDYIHASQCLEHMLDPRAALLNWSLCVKKGGHIIFTVPDFDAYEKRNWPSQFNPDHKSAWSMWRRAHHEAPMIHAPTFCTEMAAHGLGTLILRFVDSGFDYTLGDQLDQTLPEDGAECFIECVMQKQ